jgi:hypothetical protein
MTIQKDLHFMRTRILLFLVLCLTVLGVLPAAAQSSYAFIRVGHFAGDAPAVDVYLNGQLTTVQGLTLGDVTPWIAVPAGTYSVAITVAGAAFNTAVASVDGVELAAGTWATISAVGTLAEDTLALQPAVEDYKTSIADNTTRVTVFHAIQGMTGIDLVRNGASMIDTIAYPSASLGNDGAASVELLSGVVDFQISAAGRPAAVIVDVPQVTLLAKGYVSIFVYGTLQAPLYSIQTVTPAETTLVSTGNVLTTETLIVDPALVAANPTIPAGAVAFVRVGHFGSDAPNVDVYLDGELTGVTDLAYGSVTDWMAVPAGERTFAVTVTGAPVANAVMSLDIELGSDSWTTISAVGTLGADTLTLSAAKEDYKTVIDTGVTRVSVFHAITDMSGIDLVRRGVSLLDTVTFPQASLGNDGMGSVEVASGTVDFAITAAGRADAVLTTIPALELVPNSYVAILVYGTLQAPLYVVKVISEAEVNLLLRTN